MRTRAAEAAQRPEANRAILDQIVPPGNFDFAPQRANVRGTKQYEPLMMKVGEGYREILAATGLPSEVEAGWGAPLLRRPNTSVTIACRPYPKDRLIQDADHHLSRMRYQQAQARQESKRVHLQAERERGMSMLEALEDEDTVVFNTTIYQSVTAPDERALASEVRHIQNSLKGAGITMTGISHNQYASFFGASPLMADDPATTAQTAHPMPASTLGAMGIFRKDGLYDAVGTPIGHDGMGGRIQLDMLSINERRPNRNIFVEGESGAGKTTLMQKIILDELARGALVIAIDPEREQRELCRNVCGQWVNLGGTSDAQISPFRLRVAGGAAGEIDDDAAAIYAATQEGEVLSETVSFLRSFFETAFELSRNEVDCLERILKDEYAKCGVGYGTPLKDIADPNHHPVMSDVCAAVEAAAAEAHGRAQEDLHSLAGKLWPAVGGSFANLWNGRTNILPKAHFVVLDTHDLNNKADAIKVGQYFNILSWVWDLICQARITGRPIRVVIDECHLVLGAGMEGVASFVAMVAKRIRKYHGGLMCATQQVADLGTKDGKALMNLASYRFLLSTDGDNLLELKRTYNLSDDLYARLSQGIRAQGIVMAGREKVWGNIELAAYERKYIQGRGL